MRGVSPIVSTILMVAIAIAAAVVVFYIVNDFLSTQQAQMKEQAPEEFEKIRIEALSDWNNTGESITAYVRNIGKTTVTLSAAYVLKDGGVKCQLTNLNQTISPDTVVAVTLDFTNCGLNSGDSATLKIVTSEGSTSSTAFTVP